MKTHGGRSFLHGHLFGDNVHEYLAPCIYEGEGEMLGMALLQVAGQGARQDVLRADRQGACRPPASRKPNPLNPAHAWALRKAARALRQVVARREAHAGRPQPTLPGDARRPGRARRVRRRRARSSSRLRDQRGDAQAPAQAGRPPVPHGRAVAAGAGPGRDARRRASGPAASRARSCTPRPTCSART